jgi:lipopolysaccharide transport system permease protein
MNSPNIAQTLQPAQAGTPVPSVPNGGDQLAYSEGLWQAISQEILSGFAAWRVWTILGWDDIRQRYRRSILGPFWITLSMGVFIFILGVIYSRLFRTNIVTYIPYLAAGLPLWGFISQAMNESCLAFQEGTRIIKQLRLPYSIYVLRIVYRNFIILLHTIVIFVPVALYFRIEPTLATFLVVPGMLLICVNVIWLATVLAVFSARYRDMQPIVQTGIQIMMFVTPIMWPVSSLSDGAFVAEVNPFYHMVEIVRAPMLGAFPEALSWLVVCGTAIAGSAFAVALLANKSRRIVFWL